MNSVLEWVRGLTWQLITGGFAGALVFVFFQLKRGVMKLLEIPGALITGMILANYGGKYLASYLNLGQPEAGAIIGGLATWLVDYAFTTGKSLFTKKMDALLGVEKENGTGETNK